jgi:hypothetical protein
LDRTSRDKTVEIATEFGAKVFIMANSEAYNVNELDYFKVRCGLVWHSTAIAFGIDSKAIENLDEIENAVE